MNESAIVEITPLGSEPRSPAELPFACSLYQLTISSSAARRARVNRTGRYDLSPRVAPVSVGRGNPEAANSIATGQKPDYSDITNLKHWVQQQR